MMSNKEAMKLATLWAAKEVHVFPLGPGKVPLANCIKCADTSTAHMDACDCASAGRPCHGFYSATTDVALLEKLFADPKAVCVGIATGMSGLVVVDCDTPADGGPDGAHYYGEALKARGETLLKTLMVATPSGGMHCFYASEDADCLAPENRAFPLVDIKTGGSYVVAPFSVTKKGTYRPFHSVWPPVQAPQWLVDHLDRPGRLRTSSTDVMAPTSSDIKEVGNPEMYLEAVVRRAASAIAVAPRGSVYDTIKRKTFSLAPLINGGSLELEAVVRELEAAVPAFAADRTKDVRRCLNDAMGKTRAESVVAAGPHDAEEWEPETEGDDESPAPLEAAVLAAVTSITPEPEGPEEVTRVTAALDVRSRGRCPDRFWESTPVLMQIRDCARAFHKSPEALLMNTCSILASYAPPSVRVSSVDGMDPVSLNHGLVNIAGSGMGKSSVVSMAMKTAGVPEQVFGEDGQPDLSLINGVASGEGILGAFGYFEKKDDEPLRYQPLASRVRVSLDEIQAMLAILSRPNSILGACLSSMLQGQSYETPTSEVGKMRRVKAGEYRFVFTANAQPTRLMTLLETKDQGLAQRFFYVNAYSEPGADEPAARFGDASDMEEEERQAVMERRLQQLAGRRISELKGPGGESMANWVQGLPDHVIELPTAGHVDMIHLLEEYSRDGVQDELNSHKPLQVLALYGMLALLHGSVHASDLLWRNTVDLWDAMEDGRKVFQRKAMEEQESRLREADNRAISRAARTKAVTERPAVSEFARQQMRRLREKARTTDDLTRTAASRLFNSKAAKALTEAGFTRAALIDQAIYEGYLTESGGMLLPGSKG